MFEVEYIPECCELVKINKETFNLEVSKLKTIKCLCFYEFFSQPCPPPAVTWPYLILKNIMFSSLKNFRDKIYDF